MNDASNPSDLRQEFERLHQHSTVSGTRLKWVAPLVGLLVCLAAAWAPAPARADIQLAADLDYALPIDSRAESGSGFAVRLGWQFHMPLVAVTPEAVFNYEGFSGAYAPEVYRGLAGLRIGLGEVFRIGAFGHAGIGDLSVDLPGQDPAGASLTYDIGAFFDFTLLPMLNLGVHSGYNWLSGGDDPAFQWMTLGAHVELIL